MEADQAGSVGDTLAKPSLLDAATEGEVFDDLHTKVVEATHLLVDGGAKEVECSDADGVTERPGVRHSPRPDGPEAHHMKIAEEHTLAKCLDEGGGEEDEVVGLGGDGVGECTAEGVGAEEDVGVGEEEVVGWGLACGEGHGVGFAEPAGGELGDMESAEFIGMLGGEGGDDVAGRVGAAIVDGDDLQVGVVLIEKGFKCCGDVGGFVASWHDDGQGWIALRRYVVLRKEQVRDTGQASGGGDDLPEPG